MILAVLLLVLFPSLAWSACDQTTVQNQINAASNGDTVTITPADCTSSWDALSISGKYITLDGNGANITRSGTSSIISATVNSAGLTRITGFDLSSTGSDFAPDMLIKVSSCTYSTGSPNASFRIDHNTFAGDDIGHIFVGCHGRGLVDHNTFTWAGNNEVVHVWGTSSGDGTGWVDDVAPGTDAAVYFEDNTFSNTISGGYLGGKVLSVYGARVVYRYNTFDCAVIDVHGNTPRSGRFWELYGNHFQLTTCDNQDKYYQIRGGSGYIWGDTVTGTNNGAGNLIFWQDAGKTPSDQDSVGLGKNQAQDPAYVWQTQVSSVGEDDTDCSNCIVENIDYFEETGSFNGTVGMGVGTIASRPSTCTTGSGGAPGVGYWATDEGGNWNTSNGTNNDGRLYKCTTTNTWTLAYTPYTYPHPLIAGGGGGGGSVGGSHPSGSPRMTPMIQLRRGS